MDELMQHLNSLTGWLLIASLKSLPLIAILLLAQYGLRKYLSASARHSLWLSILLCLSIPFGWHLSIDTQPATLLPSAQMVETTPVSPPGIANPLTITASPTHASATNDIHLVTGNTTPRTIHYHSILSLIWLAVFSGLMYITLWQLLRFKRILQQATQASASQYARLDNDKNTLGITRKIPLLYSTQITSPLTLGLFKPTIILPGDIEQQLTEKQLCLVLLHELAHIQRRDILWNWLAYGITLLHWFNPLIWLAGKRMKADMEMACDAKVLEHLSQQDRNEYGMALINVSQLPSKPQTLTRSLGILENHRELKSRLIMIREFTTMTLKKSLVFGLVFSAFAFAALAQPNTKSNATENTPLPKTNTNMTLAAFAQHAEKDLKTQILVGHQLSNLIIPVNITEKPLDYGQFLSQLKINELTAYKSHNYIQIIPVREARSFAIPTVEKDKKYFDDEYVTDSIKLEKSCAGSVLPTLRPIVPQYGHLTAMASANTLIITDFYRNIMRVKAMIKTLEDNTTEKIDCPATTTIIRNLPTPEKK